MRVLCGVFLYLHFLRRLYDAMRFVRYVRRTNISDVVTVSIFTFTYAKLAAVASSEALVPTKYMVQVTEESDLCSWRCFGFRYKRR